MFSYILRVLLHNSGQMVSGNSESTSETGTIIGGNCSEDSTPREGDDTVIVVDKM